MSSYYYPKKGLTLEIVPRGEMGDQLLVSIFDKGQIISWNFPLITVKGGEKITVELPPEGQYITDDMPHLFTIGIESEDGVITSTPWGYTGEKGFITGKPTIKNPGGEK